MHKLNINEMEEKRCQVVLKKGLRKGLKCENLLKSGHNKCDSHRQKEIKQERIEKEKERQAKWEQEYEKQKLEQKKLRDEKIAKAPKISKDAYIDLGDSEGMFVSELLERLYSVECEMDTLRYN